MNNWQKYYISNRYHGEMPRDQIGKHEYELLGKVGDSVSVDIPEICGKPAHTQTLEVTYARNDIPNGLVGVDCLASNLRMWTERGFRIRY